MNPEITVTRLTGFGRGKNEKFNRDSLSLGTDAGCDLRFDPTWDKTVSPRHLQLEWKSGQLWLTDTSKTGTLLRGQKVTSAPVEPGAEIELGKGGPKIRVEYAKPVAATLPVATAAPKNEPPVLPVAANVSPAATPVTAAAVAAKTGSGTPGWVWALVAVLVVGVIAAVAPNLRPAPKQEEAPEVALVRVARENADAVALVVLVHPKLNNGQPEAIATAWAIGPHVFATNSHVTTPAKQVLDNGGAVFLVINRNPDKKLKVTKAVIHPRYDKEELNFEGKPHAAPAYDVGLLYTDDTAPKVFKVAPRAELEKIDSGYRVGFLGFPMEGMSGGGVEMRSPVATMQSGIITSVTDFWLAQAPFEKRLLVQHNLGAAGGASGSPIFNANGEVVAILNAGNIIGSVSFESGKVTRAPSAVMVNFAQRIDLFRDIWPDYPR
jgi:hypothetical protein